MVKSKTRLLTFLLLVTFVVPLTYFIGTNEGGRLVVRLYLAKYIQFRDIVIERTEGNLISGITLKKVEMIEPTELPRGSIVRIEKIHFNSILSHKKNWLRFRMTGVRWLSPYSKDAITFRAVSGSPLKGLRWHRLTAHAVRGLPQGSTIRVGQIHTLFSITADSLQKIQRGELLLAHSRLFLFSASRPQKGLKAKILCKRLDLRDMPALFPLQFIQSKFPPTISGLQIWVDRFEKKTRLMGRVEFEELFHSDFTVKNYKATFRVEPFLRKEELRFRGEMILKDGIFLWQNRIVRLETGKIHLMGDPSEDILDIHSSTVIDGVRIHIFITGTSEKPHFRFSSEKGFSEKRLYFMFAVGKGLKNILLMPFASSTL